MGKGGGGVWGGGGCGKDFLAVSNKLEEGIFCFCCLFFKLVALGVLETEDLH